MHSRLPQRVDAVEKVFSGKQTKFSRAADAFRAQGREGPPRFSEKRPRTFVSALLSIAAARPADAIGNAVMIAKIATGEIEDITTDDGKNAAAVALGRMGGKARAAGMTAKKRSEIAKKAAEKRWKTDKRE